MPPRLRHTPAPPLRRLAGMVVAAALVLAGCDVLPGAQAVAVLDGAVRVAPPAGYCIGQGQVREDRDTAVVLIGRCLQGGLTTPAVISVSVGHAGSAGVMLAGPEALSAFFASAQGRAMLARSGKAGDVTVLGTAITDGAFLVHLADRRAGRYWRAILSADGRLISVSALGTGAAPLTEPQSLALVKATVLAVQAANPPRPVAAPVIPGDAAVAVSGR